MTIEQTISTWRSELLGNLETMTSFKEKEDAIDILRHLSGYSARAYWMRSQLVTSNHPAANNFRTKEVDKFIEAIDIQFKIHSRIAAIAENEYRQSRGQY